MSYDKKSEVIDPSTGEAYATAPVSGAEEGDGAFRAAARAFHGGRGAPALAAGTTRVLKPSDPTPASTLFMAELMSQHLPPGVFNVICGDRDTGRALVTHPVPQMVSITGSVRAGKEVAASAAAS